MKKESGTFRVTVPPLTTLLRLKVNNPFYFYSQDWYYDEEFANRPEEGLWEIGTDLKVPAVVWAYACIHHSMYLVDTHYVWTGEKDNKGDDIYVGGVLLGRKKGLQIHRHLTIRPEMFLTAK